MLLMCAVRANNGNRPIRKAQQEDEAIVAVEDEVSSLKQETPVAV